RPAAWPAVLERGLGPSRAGWWGWRGGGGGVGQRRRGRPLVGGGAGQAGFPCPRLDGELTGAERTRELAGSARDGERPRSNRRGPTARVPLLTKHAFERQLKRASVAVESEYPLCGQSGAVVGAWPEPCERKRRRERPETLQRALATKVEASRTNEVVMERCPEPLSARRRHRRSRCNRDHHERRRDRHAHHRTAHPFARIDPSHA